MNWRTAWRAFCAADLLLILIIAVIPTNDASDQSVNLMLFALFACLFVLAMLWRMSYEIIEWFDRPRPRIYDVDHPYGDK